MKWIALFLVGCASTQANRDACYAQAEDHAAREAERLCPGGGDAWDKCPDRVRILDELAANYRGCP